MAVECELREDDDEVCLRLIPIPYLNAIFAWMLSDPNRTSVVRLPCEGSRERACALLSALSQVDRNPSVYTLETGASLKITTRGFSFLRFLIHKDT